MSDEEEDDFLPLTSSITEPLTTEDTYATPLPDAESSKLGLAKDFKTLTASGGDTNFGFDLDAKTPQKAKRTYEARTEDKAPVPTKLPRRDKPDQPPTRQPCESPLRVAKDEASKILERSASQATTGPRSFAQVVQDDGPAPVTTPLDKTRKAGATNAIRKTEGSSTSSRWTKRSPDEGWWDPNEWTKENGEWRRKSMLEKENARVSPSAPEPEVVLRPRNEPAAEELTEEDWARRAAQRQKQVQIGLQTEGYEEYKNRFPVPRPGDPLTPDPFARTPRKEFAFQLKVWRIFLHQFDKPKAEEPIE
jgi:hypothetical protein